MLHGSLGQGLCACRYMVCTVIHLVCNLGDIPHDICKMCPDAFEAFHKNLKVPDVIVLVFYNVNRNIAVRHLAQNSADIVDGLPQTFAQMVYGLGNHANFVFSAVKCIQFLVGG